MQCLFRSTGVEEWKEPFGMYSLTLPAVPSHLWWPRISWTCLLRGAAVFCDLRAAMSVWNASHILKPVLHYLFITVLYLVTLCVVLHRWPYTNRSSLKHLLKGKCPEIKFINSGMSKVIPACYGSSVQNHRIFKQHSGPKNEVESI